MTRDELNAPLDERRLYKLFKVSLPYILQALRQGHEGQGGSFEGIQLTYNIAAGAKKGNFEIKRKVNFQLEDD